MLKTSVCMAIFGLCTSAANAQSSVTLYGILDIGVNYINSDKGKSNVTLTSGVWQGNRWGLKGVEDLGGGLKTIFQLENGFSLNNGTLGQGGRLFGRQAWAGLSSNTGGSITLGRQYDSMVDYVKQLSGIMYTGIAHPYDNDNLVNSFRINNSIKYTSPNFSGIKFGGLYGFSNSANTGANSGFANNRVWSLGASYSAARLNFAAAYMHLNSPNSNTVGAVSGDYISVSNTSALGPNGLAGPVQRSEIYGIAGAYSFSSAKVSLVYTRSTFNSQTDRIKFDNYEINGNYYVTPFLSLSGIYSFTDGKLSSTGASPKYHQVQLMADYFLSKRTDIYLLGVYQRATGDATVASIAPDTFGTGGSSAPDASTTKSQVLVRLAMHHSF